MSWTAPPNPPPGTLPPRPASRSRSPEGRGRYPRYGDPPPPGAVYPPPDPAWQRDRDWDYYHRHREWDMYERDRAEWEWRRAQGMRGRSRSPGLDDDRRLKRRRSPSPFERDRYDPRPRYGDDHDAHSRAGEYGTPGRGRGRSRVADPYTLEYPATLAHFAEWYRANHPEAAAEDDAAEREPGVDKNKVGMRARYEKYRKVFSGIQLQTLYNHHKTMAWFLEKYSLQQKYVDLRARVRAEGWKGKTEQFVLELEDGKHDPVSEEVEIARAVTDPPSPSGDNDDNMKRDDEDEADGNESKVDQPARNGASKRWPVEEEVSLPIEGNQVLIRTIPPDIGRVKLEEVCKLAPGFVHLALGDPLQKRQYYRAGWIKFEDDADMPKAISILSETKIDGFKLHVHHSTKPFQGRLRVAPEIASRADRVEKDLAQIRQLAKVLEDQYAALMKRPKNDGEGGEGGENANGVQPDMDVDSEIVRGSEAVEKRIEKLVSDLPETEELEDSEGHPLASKAALIALDMYIAYLRVAFNTCYYCAAVTDHSEELLRKCIKHVRKPVVPKSDTAPAAEAESEKEKDKEKEKEKDKEKDSRRNKGDEHWAETLDNKIALLINRDAVDPKDYCGKSYDEELTKLVQPHVKQEDEGKFRCKACQKLFKASSFVEKHVANKHPELVKELDDIPFFNAFALDPHRIQPLQHAPPPANGRDQQGQAYGTQGHPPPPPRHDSARDWHGGYYAHPPPPPHPGYGHPGGGYYDPYYYPPPPYGGYRGRGPSPPPPPRRLSERMGGYDFDAAPPPPSALEGLPSKPVGAINEERERRGRRESGAGAGMARGVPPPPPPDAKEDPRASAGRKVSYHDMDEVAEGDVELNY